MPEPVHVISLRRTPQRLEAFRRVNTHLDHVVVEGVDGEALTEADIAATGLFAPDLGYSHGAIGCALSHLRLWDQAIATGRPVTVAEDDAVFRFDFHAEQERLIATQPPGWDLLLWGWNFDAPLHLLLMPQVSPVVVVCNQDNLRTSLPEFQRLEGPSALLRLRYCWGLPAYTISPRGAQRLRRACVPLRPFHLPQTPSVELHNKGIDDVLGIVSPLHSMYVSLPPLVATPNLPEISTILRSRGRVPSPPPGPGCAQAEPAAVASTSR